MRNSKHSQEVKKSTSFGFKKKKKNRTNISIDDKILKKSLKKKPKDAKQGFTIVAVLDCSQFSNVSSIVPDQKVLNLKNVSHSTTQESLYGITQILHMNQSEDVEMKDDQEDVAEELGISQSVKETVDESLCGEIEDESIPHASCNLVANSLLEEEPLPELLPGSAEKCVTLEVEEAVSPIVETSSSGLIFHKSSEGNGDTNATTQEETPKPCEKGRHKVVECTIVNAGKEIKLVVEPVDDDSSDKRECMLRDVWLSTKVQVGDTVVIDADWYDVYDVNDQPIQLAIIDGRCGMIVVLPVSHQPPPDIDNVSSDEGYMTNGQEDNETLVPYVKDKIGRHKVVECCIVSEGKEMKLILEPEYGECTIKKKCMLRDLWLNTQVQVGDTVHIEAPWYGAFDENDLPIQLAVIDGQSGLIVVSPDTLVSGTSVVSSLFCRRKAVLSERFRKSDPTNRVMLIGTLVHRLLQKAVKENCCDKTSLDAILHSLLNSPSTLQSLFYANLSVDDTKKDVKDFVPRILTFIECYIMLKTNKTPPKSTPTNRWNGKIDSVCDIEENVWSPRLGLKGKADLSVKVDGIKIPLEVKTGRSNFSAQHKGQVSLYSMMMNFGATVEQLDGLLLYLSDGAVQKVTPRVHEVQGLVQLRNEMVRYWNTPISIEGQVILPPRIDRIESCASCPLRTECSIYQVTEGGLRSQDFELLSHLAFSHLSYFMDWSKMLRLEWEDNRKQIRPLSDIWNISPRQRESTGYCLSYLNVQGSSSSQQRGTDLNELSMQLGLKDGRRLPKTFMQAGDHIILSTDESVALATGFIVKISPFSVVVTIDHCLPDSTLELVHLDQVGYQGDQSALYSNLSRLVANDPSAAKLRTLFIDRKIPLFRGGFPDEWVQKIQSPTGYAIFEPLNHLQKLAILKVLLSRQYCLIEGLPGTGKTSLIVALIRFAVFAGLSVLLTSFTHSAVDNVLVKLLKKGCDSFVRLGHQHRIHPSILPFSAEIKSHQCQTIDQVELIYSAPIVAATCFGISGHPILTKRQFDLCIVDEAAQALQLAVIGPLLGAKRFVLVGDPRQLPPIVSSKKARDMGMGVSLFERLSSFAPERVIRLREQYRMCSPINTLANKLTYDGELKCGSPDIEKATWAAKIPSNVMLPKWLLSVIQPRLVQAIVFVDTTIVSAYSQDHCVNKREAKLALLIVAALAQSGLAQNQMGVIAPYQLQVSHLKRLTRDLEMNELEINTVDQYQGRDKSVIIYSCTKSLTEADAANESQEDTGTILHDLRRLTVAVTRAKHKLIVIGNAQTLTRYSPFVKLLAALEPHQRYQLCPGVNGFQSSHIDDA